MKRILELGLLLLVTASAFGQHRGIGAGRGFRGFVGGGIRGGVPRGGFLQRGMPFRTYGSPHGFGNVIFPGVGTAPALGRRLGYYRRPFGLYYPYGFYRPWLYRPWGYPWVGPTAFPVFVGGYAYPYPSAPNVIIIYQGREPSEGVAVAEEEKQDSVESGRVRYEPPSRPAAEPSVKVSKEAVYAIAFKSGSVAAVVAHWVDQDTLHYVTSQGAHKLVSLDSVDHPLTEQLNPQETIEFRSPRAQ